MVHYILSPTKGENIIILDRATLVMGIIEGYEIYIGKIIDREIHDRAVSTDTTLDENLFG